MAFIEKADILAYMDETEYEEMVDGDDTKTVRPIADALSRIRQKLNHRYNTTSIFASPENSNYDTIKQIGVWLTIYFMYTSVQTRHIPEHREVCFHKAEEWLENIANGKEENDLPLITNDGGADGEGVLPGRGYTHSDDFIDTSF